MTAIENHSVVTVSKPRTDKYSVFGKVPARYILTACLCIGNGIMFSHRVNLTIAIVVMVNKTASENMVIDTQSNSANQHEPSCPYPEDWTEQNSTVNSNIKEGSFVWSPSVQGIVLGGFYYGYVLTQVAGGWLSERFSPKMIFLGGLVASSALTLLVPVVAEFSFGLFVALRVLTGMAQGFMFPASYNFVSIWIPNNERSLHLAVVMTGSILGTIITLPVAGYLCEEGFAGGWPSAFYVFGIVGIAVAVPCYFLIYGKPQDHPRISARELHLIEQDVIKPPSKKLPVPWSSALKSAPLWSLVFSRISSAFAFHVVITKVPTYLDVILHYPIQQNGILSSVLYMVETFTQVLAGFLSDIVRRKKWLTTNATRKTFQAIASYGAAVCLLSLPFVKCNGTAVVALLTTSLGILGFNCGGEMPVIGDMAPAYSGSLFGLVNTFSSATGFLAPMIAGAFLEGHDASITHWSYIYFMSAGLCFAGCTSFLIFGEARIQPWAQGQVLKDTEEKTKGKERF